MSSLQGSSERRPCLRVARKQDRRRPARAFYSPASIGLRTFGGPSANAGWAVRCIGSYKNGHIFFVAKKLFAYLLANNVQ